MNNQEEHFALREFRELEEGEQFVVFGDPAESKDYCAAVAFSKKHFDFPLVFTEVMESSQFGYELFYLCKYIYAKTNIWPKLAVERNTGQATIYVLRTLNYVNLFRMVDFTAQNQVEGGGIGWLTTGFTKSGELQGTRRKMLDDFALLIKQRLVTMYDQEQLKQFTNFMIVKGRAQAKSNKKDDLVMATVGAWQIHLLTPSEEMDSYDEEAYEKRREKWRFR